MTKLSTRTGGQILAQQLQIHGVQKVFCVPGESYLAALDGLYDTDINVIVCRHESGAANMAEAYGKLTGEPGICFVTRAPGATNASNGVYTASQDSTPMILLVGQVPREHAKREAFQETDYVAMFGHMAKWVTQIDDPHRIPELVARAFSIATSGRPGPVVLALPEDMLVEACVVHDARLYRAIQPKPSRSDMEEFEAILDVARRPLVVVGGGGWSAQAVANLIPFAESHSLPVATIFRSQDVFDNRSTSYAGPVGLSGLPQLAEKVRSADLIVAICVRLSDVETAGFKLMDVPNPNQTLVHISPSPEEHSRVYQPDLSITSSPDGFCAALKDVQLTATERWRDWVGALHQDYLAALSAHRPVSSGVDMTSVMEHLRDSLPRDAIVSNGAGNYAAWAHRYLQFSQYPTQLGPRSGSMGYGVPAAIAASMVHPDRIVVALAGDGCFLMTGQELATAVRYKCNLVIIIANNNMYGTIRMHQEREYPNRTIGTTLTNPDFVAYARAFGAHAELVTDTDSFPDALDRAISKPGPALIELRPDPELIKPDLHISELAGSSNMDS